MFHYDSYAISFDFVIVSIKRISSYIREIFERQPNGTINRRTIESVPRICKTTRHGDTGCIHR